MCGIAAVVGADPSANISVALSELSHRGPDATGEWRKTVGKQLVCLGHTRLSILDLTDAANQPFVSASGGAVLVFNGEIYNHHQLRAELKSLGVGFRTRSDTEVLLAAYEQFGVDSLKRLEGMFAFVIADLRRNCVVAARDSFGIKPLYYHTAGDGRSTVFASEIRALKRLTSVSLTVDKALLPEFLLNGFLYEPDSGFAGVRKVPPGGYVQIELPGLKVSQGVFRNPLEPGQEIQEAEQLIESELSRQVEADVPVGIFFSGGMDSTVLAAKASPATQAIFVDYSLENEHPDRQYAREIAQALKLAYSEIPFVKKERPESILAEFATVAAGTEEPISDYTYTAASQISKCARQAGFKVMLSGMGGDELFAGYPRYLAARGWSLGRNLRGLARPIARILGKRASWEKKSHRLESFLKADTFLQGYTQLIGFFSFEEVRRLFDSKASLEPFEAKLGGILRPVEGRSPLKQAMYLDRFGFLAHNLTVTDRASMQHGLEVRLPFLSDQIAAAAFNASDAALVGVRQGKRPLRKILKKSLGQKLIDRPKVGFNPPLDPMINGIGRDALTQHLCNGKLRDYLNTNLIREWVSEHCDQRRNHTYRLWQLCYLEFWLQCHT